MDRVFGVILSLAGALNLVACGASNPGNSGTPVTGNPAPPTTHSSLGNRVSTAYDISSGDVTLTATGEPPVSITHQLSVNPNTREYRVGGGAAPLGHSAAMTTHFTSSGHSTGRSSVFFSGVGSPAVIAGANVTRLNAAQMPTSGSASFAGDYTGYLVREADANLRAIIQGDAALTADFAGTATISGSISNRSGGGSTFSDITLDPALLSATGAFVGANNNTTGGGRQGAVPNQTVAATGTFKGFILTDTGDRLVGALNTQHTSVTFPLTSYQEYGAFHGE